MWLDLRCAACAAVDDRRRVVVCRCVTAFGLATATVRWWWVSDAVAAEVGGRKPGRSTIAPLPWDVITEVRTDATIAPVVCAEPATVGGTHAGSSPLMHE